MVKNFINESWKKLNVPGLHPDECYEISNYGRIKSYKSNPQGRIIKTPKVKGYHAIVLKMKNNKNTTKYIHKLVAEHFIPKDNPMQKYVIHINFNKDNNHVSNLRWVTKQTMFAHQKINPNYKRGQIYNAKLSIDDVIKIKRMLLNKDIKPSLVAKEFGITHTQINRIRRGENWAHVIVS